MSPRYAVYLAPPPDSALWRFGSRVLGRDAATGETLMGYAPPGHTQEVWRALAAQPRRYGFHATLKAPFRLRSGRSEAELETAITQLACACDAFDLGPLRVSPLSLASGGFVALTPSSPSPQLSALERRAVRELDAFRSPMTEEEFARRRPEQLSERQRASLRDWGYPYTHEDFRLHFTLSGPTPAPEDLTHALAESFARATDPGFFVDALCLFVQPPDGDFVLRRRFPLRST